MSLKKNIVANYLGQGWSALMGIVFVPFYIHYLGMEAYGLIGIFAILQALLTLLDMGMTPTLNREMARYTAGAHSARSIRDLLRSLEVFCFSIALLIALLIWLASAWISNGWLQSKVMSAGQVSQAIAIMGLVIALRFVESLYRGAILGLQKQVWLNSVSSGLSTLRWAGAVGVLAWVSSSIEAFFMWQGMISAMTILILVFVTYHHLPSSGHPARFSWFQLKNIWRFAGGMMATTLFGLLLMQVDKVILSRLLSLEMFGYYTLAGTVATVLYQLTGPITQAYYPQLTELVTKSDIAGLTKIFHQSAQLISVQIVPVALLLMFFGEKILLLWTSNPTLSHNTAPLLALLALGTMLNGLMHIPYMLTLAYGWPGFAVRMNMVAVIVMVPAIFWVTPRYGAIGAAWIWVMVNAGYLLIGMHFLYQRLLTKEKWHWYLYDVFLPVVGTAGMAIILWWVYPDSLTKLMEGGMLVITGICLCITSVLVTPGARDMSMRFLRGILKSKGACNG